jgi:1,4-dihydroxy-2-naphthoate octaprenyltransferase
MSRARTYAQLVRLPNVPTALADICLGALGLYALQSGFGPWLPFVFLLASSACLYMGGMVFNDYFDREQDRRERPERPIPSGRISPRDAARVGAVLLAGGFLLALLAGTIQVLQGETSTPLRPTILAGLLIAFILLYDAKMKRTWTGPIFMGGCRFVNVLLGACAAGSALEWGHALHLALIVGTYIAGVTWFARTEARTSSQMALTGAAGVMLASLVLALPIPLNVTGRPAGALLFPYLLVGLGFFVGYPVCRAIAQPTAGNVQATVKRSILGLVLLDAVLATGRAGLVGLLILLLLAPAFYLQRRRWLYAT